MLKAKYNPTLTIDETIIIVMRVFGESEDKELSSLLGCTSYSFICRVIVLTLTVAVNCFISTSTV